MSALKACLGPAALLALKLPYEAHARAAQVLLLRPLYHPTTSPRCTALCVTSRLPRQCRVPHARILAAFETDPKRAAAMHKLRVARLEHLVGALNPQVCLTLPVSQSIEGGPSPGMTHQALGTLAVGYPTTHTCATQAPQCVVQRPSQVWPLCLTSKWCHQQPTQGRSHATRRHTPQVRSIS